MMEYGVVQQVLVIGTIVPLLEAFWEGPLAPNICVWQDVS